jgi:hypothetical protein
MDLLKYTYAFYRECMQAANEIEYREGCMAFVTGGVISPFRGGQNMNGS